MWGLLGKRINPQSYPEIGFLVLISKRNEYNGKVTHLHRNIRLAVSFDSGDGRPANL
jgi:hypothetical protein